MSSPPRLIILGTSATALAVARNATDLAMRPIVIDTAEDIAASTRRAEVRIFRDRNADALLEHITTTATATPAWLIATSDAWLRFVMQHRETLQRHFVEILHPDNSTLGICLDKSAFAQWCVARDLPAPRLYDAAQVLTDSADVRFPLLLRPRQSNAAERGRVPKAVEVHDAAEFTRWTKVFDEAAAVPLVTESLLGRRLTQYSVGAARRGAAMMTFVAIKRRPLPEVCGVGSYVELAPNPQVEILARRALDALEFQGIAEVEILRDEGSKRDYVIEINARPWVQYGLGAASGHDLLAFMLDPGGHDPRRAKSTGRRWINLSADSYYCFSRSVGLVRSGRIPFRTYLSSVVRANTFAYFSPTDPGPAWRNLGQWLKAVLVAHA